MRPTENTEGTNRQARQLGGGTLRAHRAPRRLVWSALAVAALAVVAVGAMLVWPDSADAHEGDNVYSHHIKHNLGDITNQKGSKWL